jgi:hypothetical protein
MNVNVNENVSENENENESERVRMRMRVNVSNERCDIILLFKHIRVCRYKYMMNMLIVGGCNGIEGSHRDQTSSTTRTLFKFEYIVYSRCL